MGMGQDFAQESMGAKRQISSTRQKFPAITMVTVYTQWCSKFSEQVYM